MDRKKKQQPPSTINAADTRRMYLASRVLLEHAEACANSATGPARWTAIIVLVEAKRVSDAIDMFIEQYSED